MNDLRFALRLLGRSRLFTLTVIATIAIGTGATTTIFSVVNATLLRPLPFRDPDRLVQVAERNDRLHLATFTVSALNFLSWQEQQRSFEQLGAMGFQTFTVSDAGDPETFTGGQISASVLPVLGLGPLRGRAFTPDDERPGAGPVALIGESLWRRKFAGDPRIVGRAETINGVSCTIVGIAPPALTLLVPGDIWTPLVIDPPKELRLNHVLVVVGRLRPGVTFAAAQAEMDTVASRVAHQYPEMRDWGIRLVTLTDTVVSSNVRTGLLVLLGAVLFLLAIVSANVANLLLVRAMERRREMAVRTALGARRGRLVRQLLVESLVLSGLGGVAGVGIAVWSVSAIQAALPPSTLPVPDIGIDRTVILFAAAVTLVTGIIFGLVPAWRASRTEIAAELKEAARAATGRHTLRRVLAAGELALATVLLVGAVLLTRSLLLLEHVPLGFDPDGVITFQLSLPQTKYDANRRNAFFLELDHELASLPGVERSGLSSGIPFGAGLFSRSPFTASGSKVLPPAVAVPTDWRMVSPGYFDTVRVPLLEGRRFTDSDTTTAPPVVIVSRAAARTFWGTEDPIGKIVRKAVDTRDYLVVGVVGDVRNLSLDSELPTLYLPSGFRTWPSMDVVVRPTGDVASVMAAVRAKVRALDPNLALSNVRPMTEWVSASAAQPRLNAVLLAVFAIVALAVAAIGTYGVLAYSVSQRSREIGLRMALGADRRTVLRLIVREGLTSAVPGIGAGALAAVALSRLVGSLVFGVSPRDPLTYIAVVAVLGAVAVTACVVPARRAAQVDPMIALRLE